MVHSKSLAIRLFLVALICHIKYVPKILVRLTTRSVAILMGYQETVLDSHISAKLETWKVVALVGIGILY